MRNAAHVGFAELFRKILLILFKYLFLAVLGLSGGRQDLQLHLATVVVGHRLSCSVACGIFVS